MLHTSGVIRYPCVIIPHAILILSERDVTVQPGGGRLPNGESSSDRSVLHRDAGGSSLPKAWWRVHQLRRRDLPGLRRVSKVPGAQGLEQGRGERPAKPKYRIAGRI